MSEQQQVGDRVELESDTGPGLRGACSLARHLSPSPSRPHTPSSLRLNLRSRTFALASSSGHMR